MGYFDIAFVHMLFSLQGRWGTLIYLNTHIYLYVYGVIVVAAVQNFKLDFFVEIEGVFYDTCCC